MRRFLCGMSEGSTNTDGSSKDEAGPRFSVLAQIGLLAALPLMAVFEVGDPVEANVASTTAETIAPTSWSAGAKGPNQQMALALADEYQAMAERYGSGRPSSSLTASTAMFTAKGRMASEGQIPLPEELGAHQQTSTNAALIWDARQRLTGAIEHAALRQGDTEHNQSLVRPAAKAQVFFDCWIAHAATKEHVAATCQNRFESALAVLNGAEPLGETATP